MPKPLHSAAWSYRNSGMCSIFLFILNYTLKGPLLFSRFSERKWRSSSGSLPGRHLSLRHHLLGVSDPRPPRAPGRGLWIREASETCDFPELGLHGPAAAVRDRRPVSLHSSGFGKWRHRLSVPLLRQHRPLMTFIMLQRDCVRAVTVISYCWRKSRSRLRFS